MAKNLIASRYFDAFIGFLSRDTPASWRAYKERADTARKRGVALVQIRHYDGIDGEIERGKKIAMRYWDGKSMQEFLSKAPEVLYDRWDISSYSGRKIAKAFERDGKKFINPPLLRDICADKARTYKIFKKNFIPTPETFIYSDEHLEYLLKKKGFVFVKKRISSQGKNQIVIRELGKNDYLIIPSNYSGELKRVGGFDKVLEYMRNSNVNKGYLVQEGINVDRLEGRVYDFRAIFQRGRQGHLGMTCFYVRVGASSSEQANIGKKGHPQDPYVVFENYDCLKKDIEALGKKVVNSLSEYCSVGEIGIDFVFDDNHNIFVIEANSKPGSKGIRTLREWNPIEKDYRNLDVIPYEYNNQIRSIWGANLDKFLSKPFLYGKYLSKI